MSNIISLQIGQNKIRIPTNEDIFNNFCWGGDNLNTNSSTEDISTWTHHETYLGQPNVFVRPTVLEYDSFIIFRLASKSYSYTEPLRCFPLVIKTNNSIVSTEQEFFVYGENYNCYSHRIFVKKGTKIAIKFRNVVKGSDLTDLSTLNVKNCGIYERR